MNTKQGARGVILLAAVLFALGLGGAPAAWGFTITSNQDVGAGAALSGSGAETISCAGGTGAVTNPYVYAWSGSPSADLVLGAAGTNRISTTNGKSFILDLLRGGIKGSVIGTQSNSVTAFSTANSGGTAVPGAITLTNVGDVTVGKIDTSHSSSDPGVVAANGSVTVGSSGNRAGTVRIAGITTIPNYGVEYTYKAGGVSIYATGSVSICDGDGTRRNIDASGPQMRGAGGAITIDHAGNLYAGGLMSLSAYGVNDNNQSGGAVTLTGTGALDVSLIHSYGAGLSTVNSGNGGNVTISGYTARVTVTNWIDASCGIRSGLGGGDSTRAGTVAIGSAGVRVGPILIGGITTQYKPGDYGNGQAGAVSLYGSGNILIASNGVPMSILANGVGRGAARITGGNVTIDHTAGNFLADLLDTSVSSTYFDQAWCKGGGTILADGRNGGGSFQVNGINTYGAIISSQYYPASGGAVTIRNYGAVTIVSNVNTYTTDTHASAKGGDLTITNIAGDIAIGGTINLAKTGNAASNGVLRLQCGGNILLGTLDLSKVKSATLYAGAGQSTITNQLLNFPTNNPASGLLDAVTNQTIRYDSGVASNAYLLATSNGRYTLKSGGVLKARVADGAVLVVR